MAHPAQSLFDMGEDGAVAPAPLMNWACTPLADLFVLLRVRYATSRDELAAGGRTAQMTMSPQQALQLAEALRTRAELVLNQKPSGRVS